MSSSDKNNVTPTSTVTTTEAVTTTEQVNQQRRHFFMNTLAGAFGAAAMMNMVPSAIRSQAWAAGSDAPEITEVKVGFIPLTDCAPIIVASQMGFDKK
jgi:nitrate/nitrite transport system substrate-binding protein